MSNKFLVVFVLLLVDTIHAHGSIVIPRRFRRPKGVRGTQPRMLKEKKDKKNKKGDYYEGDEDFDSMLHSIGGKHLPDFFQNVVKDEVSGQVNEHLSKMEATFGLVSNETTVIEPIIEVSNRSSLVDGLNSTARR